MAEKNGLVYTVYVETTRALGAPVPIVRALSPESAAEIVRILLDQTDTDTVSVSVKPEKVI